MPLPSDDKLNETASTLTKTLKGAFGTPDGFRPAHARGILLKGSFKPTKTATELSKAHHFNASSTPVIIRFSNSTGIPTIPDNANDANPRGMAVRFELPNSADGKRQHTDLVIHSTPYFPTRTGEGFLELLGAIGASSAPDAPKNPSPIEKFLGENPSAMAFVTAPKPTPKSFGTLTYYGVNAFKLVSEEGTATYVRYRVVPEAGDQHLSEEEVKGTDAAFLHNEIQTRVMDGPVGFKLMAQVAEEGDVTDDATVHWPSERKMVELGTLKVESVMEQNDEEQRKIIFDPVPRIEGVEPSEDPLLNMRASVYLQSGRQRRAAKSFA